MYAHPLLVTLPWRMLGAVLSIPAPLGWLCPVPESSSHSQHNHSAALNQARNLNSLIVLSALLSLRVSGGNNQPQESALTHATPVENIRMALVIQL